MVLVPVATKVQLESRKPDTQLKTKQKNTQSSENICKTMQAVQPTMILWKDL